MIWNKSCWGYLHHRNWQWYEWGLFLFLRVDYQHTGNNKKVTHKTHVISWHRPICDGCWDCFPKSEKLVQFFDGLDFCYPEHSTFDCGQTLKSYGVRFRLKVWWASQKHMPEREAGCHNIIMSLGSQGWQESWLCSSKKTMVVSCNRIGGCFILGFLENSLQWRSVWGTRLVGKEEAKLAGAAELDAVTSEASSGPIESSAAGRVL